MSLTIEQIKERCPRFRILVIGRRNAGKTTILKKMCDSDGSDLKIVDRNGNNVDASILEPDHQRGMSNIENEITFGSNPLFVFHDSRGIEAGAEHDENSTHRTNFLWEFLDKRSRKPRIQDQIHAVWMCIPMDNPRAPSPEFELAFFNTRDSPVPVIAVFTKFEALIDEAYNDLPEDDLSDTEKDKNASRDAQSKFEKTVQKAIENTTHPPDQCVQLQNLNEAETRCVGLAEATYSVIQDEALSDVFALAQRSSFRIGCKKVLELINREQEHWIQRVDRRKILENIIFYTGTFIPYWRPYAQAHQAQDSLWTFIDSIFPGSNGIVTDIPHCLSIGITTCIVLVSTGERSEKPITLVDPTIQLLQNRLDFGVTITSSVQTALSEFPQEVNHEKLICRLVDIVIENVDSLRTV
ncbi:hypothetical protein B0H14DRAFT_2974143 [Mycena olivaceomarginata]|nr:hypothetical protein B0H14DRAFT_2974143 [Mycena olivaceomarginata]